MITIEPPKNKRTLTQDPHDDPATFKVPTNQPTTALPQSSAPIATEPQHQAFTLHLPNHQQAHVTMPASAKHQQTEASRDSAADFIRGKIERLYQDEPSAKDEIAAIEKVPGTYSKHQEFVMRLVQTGRPLSEIQSAWHEYYGDLPDHEKHQVWQEFYASYERASKFAQALMAKQQSVQSDQTNTGQSSDTSDTLTSPLAHTVPAYERHHQTAPNRHHQLHPHADPQPEPIRPYSLNTQQKAVRRAGQLQTIGALKSQLVEKITARSRTSKSTHLKSLAFGLGTGMVFIVLILFSFFNERFITPFIMPGKASASTQLIIDPNQNADVGPESKIIIPKLNVEVPVVYDVATIEEKDIQHALESGVVHYPITEKPGELGNGVIVGHSSNNILNKGKYKFAFLMLKKLETGDTFYIHFNNKRYVYKIYESKVVEATDVSVLDDTDRPATFTLITCDPPGTSARRLIVRGEQISPEPAGNIASTATPATEQPAVVPGNSQSLFQRMTDWIF